LSYRYIRGIIVQYQRVSSNSDCKLQNTDLILE